MTQARYKYAKHYSASFFDENQKSETKKLKLTNDQKNNLEDCLRCLDKNSSVLWSELQRNKADKHDCDRFPESIEYLNNKVKAYDFCINVLQDMRNGRTISLEFKNILLSIKEIKENEAWHKTISEYTNFINTQDTRNINRPR